MKYYYICAGGKQCALNKNSSWEQCYKGCRYTSNFFYSKLYHQGVKPAKPINFIKDTNGNYWEINWDWSFNLPDSFRAKPEEIIARTYDAIEQYEIHRIGDKTRHVAPGSGIKILF